MLPTSKQRNLGTFADGNGLGFSELLSSSIDAPKTDQLVTIPFKTTVSSNDFTKGYGVSVLNNDEIKSTYNVSASCNGNIKDADKDVVSLILPKKNVENASSKSISQKFGEPGYRQCSSIKTSLKGTILSLGNY